MAWQIRFTQAADKILGKLDPHARKKILRYLRERVLALDDPRSLGKPLRGGMAGLWRYRVEDYRVICEIRSQEMIVLVIKIGHRSDVYG